MSPGPLSSSHRGGLSFTHGGGRNFSFGYRQAAFYGTRQAPRSVDRLYGADRQRFSVAPNETGGSTITLDENETATVGDSDEGGVTISIDPAEPEDTGEGDDAGGNGGDVEFEVQQRRGLYAPRSPAATPGEQERLHVSANPNGSITIDVTDPARQLVVLGDPESNVLTVGKAPKPAD